MSAPEYQSVPVTMLDWRETRDLLPDQKFIFSYLWWARESNWCGVYLLPIEATAARLSLTARALEDALAEFRRRRLIDMDDDTGEIYIEKWLYCRHNTGARFEIMWESSMAAVRSRRLWEKANKAKNSIKSRLHDANGNGNKNGNKNKAVAPSATNSNDIRCATDDNAATQTQKKQKQKTAKWPSYVHGVMCWSADDVALASGIVRKFGEEAVGGTVADLVGTGEKALPSRVLHMLAPHPILPPGWDATKEGIKAAAIAVGVGEAKGNESWESYKARIWEAARVARSNPCKT